MEFFKKIKWGKWLVDLLLTSFIAGILFAILNVLVKTITGGVGVFASTLQFVIAGVALTGATIFRPGKEEFFQTITTLVFVLAVFGLFSGFGFKALTFEPEFSLIGFVFGLATILFSEAVTMQITKKLRI